ncbi:MAG: glycine cleavage system aminomethyltransferase GcvT [Clostridia bacterium]|nr:glycine cleavage system aminomethyltransferase GcvT [Clostridia bacterium]
MERKTPLYHRHVANNGKMVPFAGYLLPVQYGTGIIAEHMAVRTKAGLFDVSHMGEAEVKGPGALDMLQSLCTNDLSVMADGQVKYTLLCDENGGVIDDVLVYRFAADHYWVVLNASNQDKDFSWMQTHCPGNVVLRNLSDATAQLALQGPLAMDILGGQPLPAKNYTFMNEVTMAGVQCMVSRTGYTGEDGVELYCANKDAPMLWGALLAQGAIPCGLGARDTLRLEAGMPLYGHELTMDITPLEAGLKMFVKFDKPGFIGKEALIERSEPSRRRAGLRIHGRGIAREGCPVYAKGNQIGHTTSGTHAPYLGYAIAMALLDVSCIHIGTQVEIDVRGRWLAAEVVALPFYKRVRGVDHSSPIP